MTKIKAAKIALGVGVCAILASVVMLGACGGSEMTDEDAVNLYNAIQNTATYDGSYTYTDNYTYEESESEDEYLYTEEYGYYETYSCSASYDSSSMDCWMESSYLRANSDSGTTSNYDENAYRVVAGNLATTYTYYKNKLWGSISRDSSTGTISANEVTIYSFLPSSICRSMSDVDDFLSVIYYSTEISFNEDPDYYSCTVSGRDSSKTTYTFSLNYKYKLNSNGIKETDTVKLTTVFTVKDDMLVGFKTTGSNTYSLGNRYKESSSESFEREIKITLKYKDNMPKDFSDWSD